MHALLTWHVHRAELPPSVRIDMASLVQIWPEEQFPFQRVGMLTLNQTTANFFNDNEQLAFSPAHIVPGAQMTLRGLCIAKLITATNSVDTTAVPDFNCCKILEGAVRRDWLQRRQTAAVAAAELR